MMELWRGLGGHGRRCGRGGRLTCRKHEKSIESAGEVESGLMDGEWQELARWGQSVVSWAGEKPARKWDQLVCDTLRAD
jgi:hypothetical protein